MTVPRRPRVLTPAQQFVNLKSNPLTRGDGTLWAGRLTWHFEARPSPISRGYAMRLHYAVGNTPDMFVDEPDLVKLAGGRDLPHVYSQQPTRLCLFLPGTPEWTASMLLDRTVVPWSVLWLWYFEDWLSIGEWRGGGLLPRRRPSPRRSQCERSAEARPPKVARSR